MPKKHFQIRARILLFGQKAIERGAWYLAPFSWVWGLISLGKNFLYDRKWLYSEKVSCPVVSVGNLVAGGTGKTPFVQMLASRFSQRKVAVLSRGYGQIPDEAILLQNRNRKIKVYIGKDRVKLAKQAVREGAELILLDDGFQYRKLYRDFDFVLLSGSDPFGKGHYLPWGFLRDSPRRLKFADALFVTGELRNSLSFPHISLEIQVERILDLQKREVSSIEGKKVAIFCGIAKPKLFRKTVENLKATVVSEWILADHEKPSIDFLMSSAASAKQKGAQAFVCTEKDMVKIPNSLQSEIPIYYLEISLRIARGVSEWENLIAKIEKKIDTYTKEANASI